MLRLLLPPNLVDAAARDAIAIKIEWDPGTPIAPELIPGLAQLQSLCGGAPKPPPFIQSTRAQLRQLIKAFAGHPVFAWLREPGKPLLWIGPHLRGVSEHLHEPKAAIESLSRPARNATSRTASVALPTTPHPPARRARDTLPAAPPLVDGSEHYLAITLPSREHSAYSAVLDLVRSNGFVLEPANRKWWLRNRHKTLNFLASHRHRLEKEFFAEFTPNFEKQTAHLRDAKIHCEVASTRQGDYALTLGVDAGDSDAEQLREAIATNRSYVESKGRVYLIAQDLLGKLAGAQHRITGGQAAPLAGRRIHRIPIARVPELDGLIAELAPGYRAPAAWRREAEALKTLTALPPAPIPKNFALPLRPYQQIGAAWLWYLHTKRLGGILADEMGLGKTAQAIALLASIYAQTSPQPQPPSLVICPASLVENWRRELARFAPDLRVFVHHSSQRLQTASDAGRYEILLTSYGTAARDRELFAGIDLLCLVADEAQHAKNRRTQNARMLRSLHARSRFFLTGTPLENSLDDLRSLFESLLPGVVEKLPVGLDAGERAFHDERLRAQVAPYILRRTKQAVAPELPEKIEQVLYCELGDAQRRFYQEYQTRSEQTLTTLVHNGANEGAMRLAMLTELLRLRQICCDPRLLFSDAEAAASAKLAVFRELLTNTVEDGHRLLVFSQFTSMLALLRDELDAQGLIHCYLDGSMPTKKRQAEVDRFQQNPDIPVFLISLKAGGLGLNLTGADTIVHFDPWWNPAVEAQASDRAHRIGQTRVVTSYKLICSGTVEEKVFALQERKRALLADIYEASDAANAKLELADLRDLLRN